MSGEKCAEASLSDEAQQELQQTIAAAVAMDEVRVDALAARERALSLHKEIEAQLRQYLPAEVGKLEAALARLAKEAEAQRTAIAEVAALSTAVGDVRARRDAARRKYVDTQELVAHLKQAARDVTDLTDSVSRALTRAVRSAEQDQIRASIRRAEVAEVRARIAAGFEAEGGLSWVSEPARTLDKQLAELQGSPEQATPEALGAAREELGRLTERARQLDYQNYERWEIAELLHAAFQRAGFSLARGPGAPKDVGSEPVRFRHELNSGTRQSATETAVTHEGAIYMDMMGAQGSVSATVTADDACGGSIEDLVREAEKLGLLIRNVLWKGPDGGWCTLKQQPAVAEHGAFASNAREQEAKS